MEIIEFKTLVKDGIIKIPKKYKNRVSQNVKVVIYTEPAEKKQDFIEELLSNPLKAEHFKPIQIGRAHV